MNRGIEVLQTFALPLGYSAIFLLLTIYDKLNGGWTRNRTRDTRIFSPLLYRLSYPAMANTLIIIRAYILFVNKFMYSDIIFIYPVKCIQLYNIFTRLYIK